MSDTPETDAAAFDAFDGQGGEVVFAAFASQLERERNQWRIQYERLHKSLQEETRENQARLAKDVIKTASNL